MDPFDPEAIAAGLAAVLEDAALDARLAGETVDVTLPGRNGTRGGLRATGGLMLGPMSLLQSSSGVALGRASTITPSLSAGRRSLSLLLNRSLLFLFVFR